VTVGQADASGSRLTLYLRGGEARIEKTGRKAAPRGSSAKMMSFAGEHEGRLSNLS